MTGPRSTSERIPLPLRLALGLALGALAVYFAAREISLDQMAAAFAGVRPGWLAAALAATFAGQFIKALRWRVMLSSEPGAPGMFTVWVYHLSGQLGNILVPGPAGDVGRIVILGGRGQGRVFTLGTVALEKVLDLVVYAFLVILVLVSLPLPGWISNSALTLVGFAAAAAAAALAGAVYRDRLSRAWGAVLGRLPGAWGERVRKAFRTAAGSLRAMRRRSRLVRLALTTLLLWSASILVNHWMLAAFGLSFPLSVSVLLLVVLQLGVSTNLVPGTIGLFEFLCVETLALFDVPRQVAFSYGLALHLVVLAPLVTAAVVGALGGWRRGAWTNGRMGE
jgi:uncharacterized protein (TIRG00374 family)